MKVDVLKIGIVGSDFAHIGDGSDWYGSSEQAGIIRRTFAKEFNTLLSDQKNRVFVFADNFGLDMWAYQVMEGIYKKRLADEEIKQYPIRTVIFSNPMTQSISKAMLNSNMNKTYEKHLSKASKVVKAKDVYTSIVDVVDRLYIFCSEKDPEMDKLIKYATNKMEGNCLICFVD